MRWNIWGSKAGPSALEGVFEGLRGPRGALLGVPECGKSRFGEPTKDPSSRRYDINISVRPKSPVQPLVARVGTQMRQISLSWWPRWPALGYKLVP